MIVARAALVTAAVVLAVGPVVLVWWSKKMLRSIEQAVRWGN